MPPGCQAGLVAQSHAHRWIKSTGWLGSAPALARGRNPLRGFSPGFCQTPVFNRRRAPGKASRPESERE